MTKNISNVSKIDPFFNVFKTNVSNYYSFLIYSGFINPQLSYLIGIIFSLSDNNGLAVETHLCEKIDVFVCFWFFSCLFLEKF